LALAAGTAAAQPTREELAKDPNLFLESARKALKWDEPTPPTKIAGPIHFVGTKGLGSFLIAGSEGHVVIYTGMPGSGESIEKSIVKLGFKPKDVKILLTGHAHIDHVGGHAALKKATGAKIALLREEVELFDSGGKRDFHYGEVRAFAFDSAKVDTSFRDGDTIRLGDIAILVHHTPGHTRGSTTYTTTVKDVARTYSVVFADGTGVNPGYRLAKGPSYPDIADDFRRTFRTLEGLKPEIWLTPHNDVYGLDVKRENAAKAGPAAWVDPDGYRKWVALQKGRFETALKADADRK